MSKHIPESLKGAKSPFLDNLIIPVIARQYTEDLMVAGKQKVEDGIVVSTGPLQKITKGYVLEKDKKVELYVENNGEDLRPAYSSLGKEGRMLLEYIMLYCLRENKLVCHIDTQDFMDKYNISSRTTVWNCRKNLIDNTFIASTSSKGWYWINPKFIFRGYRTKVLELQNNLDFKNKDNE
jgi:hypothetical protein